MQLNIYHIYLVAIFFYAKIRNKKIKIYSYYIYKKLINYHDYI